jgi:hypothetical protein
MTGNGIKAGWTIALQGVLTTGRYDMRPIRVVASYAQLMPVLLIRQAVALFRIESPFAKCLWPVLAVLEPAAPASERSSALTADIRYPAAALSVRVIVFAIFAIAYCLFVIPSGLPGGNIYIDRTGMLIFVATLASLIFTACTTSALASFPFLYLRARSIHGEAAEPALPAKDSPEFPGNRIPVLTRATKLWIAAGVLALGVPVYVRMLHGSSPEKWTTADKLIHAAEAGRLRTMKRLLSSGADVNSHLRPWTPLTRATLFGQETAIDLLLKAGADVNFHDPAVGSATYLAAVAWRNAILAKLLEHGADPNVAPSWGVTPLMAASMGGNEPAVRLLLQHGADPKRRHPDGRLAADLAREEGQMAVVRLLERGGPANTVE